LLDGLKITGRVRPLQVIHRFQALLNRGKNICLDIKQGKTDEQVISNAIKRFESSTVKLTPEQGAQIVESARKNLC